MNKVLGLLLGFTLLVVFPGNVYAKTNPLGTQNNKFGIHVVSENDFKNAASLVNSSGGDWGYVTFVITQDERNTSRWQRAFDEARKLHLIPIVRVATKYGSNVWETPAIEDIDSWVDFFNALNWVIENRYVVIGNEPNHAAEWGGKVDPEGYATYLGEFVNKLHTSNPDYFVLPAGFDASARTNKETMDEALFIKNMIKENPNVFNDIDGWTSHSYPNPDFAGKATDTGRGSIQTYTWELAYLESVGVANNLPVFITETGWSNKKVDPEDISGMYKYAFSNVWNDQRVVAITPFILNYSNPPFSEFSWIKEDGSKYPYYDAYKAISKTAGAPIQKDSGQIIGAVAQPLIYSNSDYFGAILVKNTGQSIWDKDNVLIVSDDPTLVIQGSVLFTTEPGRTALVIFKAKNIQTQGIYIRSLYMAGIDGKRITNSFPIEALVVKPSKFKIGDYVSRSSLFVKSLFLGNK